MLNQKALEPESPGPLVVREVLYGTARAIAGFSRAAIVEAFLEVVSIKKAGTVVSVAENVSSSLFKCTVVTEVVKYL